jgi:hypothetical protein
VVGGVTLPLFNSRGLLKMVRPLPYLRSPLSSQPLSAAPPRAAERSDGGDGGGRGDARFGCGGGGMQT